VPGIKRAKLLEEDEFRRPTFKSWVEGGNRYFQCRHCKRVFHVNLAELRKEGNGAVKCQQILNLHIANDKRAHYAKVKEKYRLASPTEAEKMDKKAQEQFINRNIIDYD